MGIDQPVLSIITAPTAVMMSSKVCHSGLPPLVLHACFWGEGQEISLRDSPAMCLAVLSFGTVPEPSLVCFFLPAREMPLLVNFPSPLGMGAFSHTRFPPHKGDRSSFQWRRQALEDRYSF
jgi:hypothetical protein